MKDLFKNIKEEELDFKRDIVNRAEARRTMKKELKMMESKLGEKNFGYKMCKEYGLPTSLKYRYGVTARVFTLMLERGEQEHFEDADGTQTN